MTLVIPPNAIAMLFIKCRDTNAMGIPIPVRIHDQGYGSKTQLPQSHTSESVVHIYAGANTKPKETAKTAY